MCSSILPSQAQANANPPSIRAFVALAPSLEMLPALAAVQNQLRATPAGRHVRWTQPEHIHLTLRFLGNIPVADVPDTIAQIQSACRGAEPFTVELTSLGCFPNPLRPRIVWIGLAGDIPRLLSLQSAIAEALAEIGDHHEAKPFHPHLTLGRIRPGPRLPRLDFSRWPTPPRPGPWRVESVDLMRSKLQPGGARYQLVYRYSLPATADREFRHDPANKGLQSDPNAL